MRAALEKVSRVERPLSGRRGRAGERRANSWQGAQAFGQKVGPLLSSMVAVGIVLIAVAVSISVAASADEMDVSSDVEACRNDPRFRETGGAVIGNCLLEVAAVVDAEIERVLSHASKSYCQPEDREILASAQSRWVDYREQWCGLVARSPGNTPAYVNSAACMLFLGRQRLSSLSLVTNYGYANCQ